MRDYHDELEKFLVNAVAWWQREADLMIETGFKEFPPPPGVLGEIPTGLEREFIDEMKGAMLNHLLALQKPGRN